MRDNVISEMPEQAGDVQLPPSADMLSVVAIYESVVETPFLIFGMVSEPLFK
jgi:hypothetical protein